MNTARHILVTFLLALSVACAGNPKPDTSGLDAEGLRNYQLLQVVKAVNDVTVSAVTANRANLLPAPATDVILRINKQVLDIIDANPTDFTTLAVKAVDNARDALTPEMRTQINLYMERLLAAINVLNRER